MDIDWDKDDFGFTTVDHVPESYIIDAQERLDKVKSMIVPLLDNLMKDPEKDIHWPDRDKKLKDFKKKLLKIIEG